MTKQAKFVIVQSVIARAHFNLGDAFTLEKDAFSSKYYGSNKTTETFLNILFYNFENVDTIMDLLNCSQARRAILDYYQTSGEPQAVQEAIKVSEKQAMCTFTLARMKNERKGYVHA